MEERAFGPILSRESTGRVTGNSRAAAYRWRSAYGGRNHRKRKSSKARVGESHRNSAPEGGRRSKPSTISEPTGQARGSNLGSSDRAHPEKATESLRPGNSVAN